jgi:hypothetical protein
MTTALLDGVKAVTEISKLSQEERKYKAKEKSKAGDIAIKKATLLGSMPTEGGTMGEGLMAGANRMAQNPHHNAWTGLIEGLMRGFGVGLKGKEAAEKRKQVEDALEVLNYAMEGQEYLQGVQSQIAQRKEDYASMPSENQYMDAASSGTLEPTLQSLLQEKGVDPKNVTLSSDKMTLFVDKGGQIEKIPVASLFNPEDSKQFGFAHGMVKSNLTQSANEQVRGLAQENNTMKSKLEIYQDMFSKIQGVDPQLANMVAQGVVEGEAIEKQKLGNETMKAEASKQNSDIAVANAPFDQASKKAYATDVNNRWDPEQVSSINLAKKQAANIANHVVSLRESNHRIETALHEFSMLESLLNDPKRAVITGDTLKSKAKRFFAGVSGSKTLSDTELYDAFEKGFFAHFKGDVKFGNMNKEQFMLEMDQMPHSKFTKQGMLDIIEMQRQKLTAQKTRNDEEIKLVPHYTSRLNEQYSNRTGRQENPSGTNNAPPQPNLKTEGGSKKGGVWMKKGSARLLMPYADVKEAINDGFEVDQ